jgi:transposase
MKNVEEKPAAEVSTPTAPDGETVRGVSEIAGVGRRERAAGLRSEGWSNKQIAAELGVHPSTVGRWLTSTRTRGSEPVTSPSMKEES